MKKALSIIFALLINAVSWSQNYPIQSSVTITPPYSVYLSDYASISSNKLMVNLMLKDPMEPRVDITLRVTIKGNGIELRTRDDYRPQPLELNGGVPLLLSGPDLESYLNPANLTFSGISKSEFVKTGKLPEGVYQFSVEALSYDRPGVVLSNSGMTVGWLVLNDPPHWTLPMQNSLLTATYPQFVNFSWMPMNTGSPNAAFTTEYEFTIVELWPEDRAPGDAINSFAPLFQTVTNNTSLVYGPAEPELTPGRKYVCRLRAYDTEGRDLFKNNGYSEILVFTFGQACLPPNTFTDKIISPDEARVEWTTLPGHTQFILSYSEQNPDGTWSNWYHNEGIMPYSNLDDLKPEHKYRYQLKAICGTIESEYSETGEFTMPEADTTEKVCGQGAGVPDIDDSPPLPTLRIGDRIDAGGFTALVTEAEGANGNFTGKCILFVKTFGYAPIYSEFSGIGVNQSMQLTSGSIKSVMGELNIHSLDSIISDLGLGGGNDITGGSDPNVGDPYEPGDTVTVTLGDEEYVITGDTIIITAGGDTITTDFGQIPPIIVVNGDTTDVTTDELDFDNPGGGSDGTSDVASNVTDTAAYAIKLVKFRAAKDQFFGFDRYPDDIPKFRADYNMEKVNDQGYKVHWKSAQSNGMNDKVVMEITAEVPDSIRSRLSIESSVSGVLNYSFSPKDSVWEVIVTGKSHEDEDHIIAWYTQDDGSRIAVGHLNMVSYNKQNMRLVIVPVNNDYTLEAYALKDSLDNIYKGAITFWDVSVAARLNVDFEENDIEGVDTDLPDMAANTKEMRNIRNAMQSRGDHDPDAQYLFLVAKSEKGNKNGIMPFRRRYGFIFMEDDGKLKDNMEKLFHTMAHELGHGPFGLEHPWQEKGTTQGATYNLMDYSNKEPNNLLRKYQWYYIHNPKASLLGGDEEEVSNTMELFFENPDLTAYSSKETEEYIYLTPAAKPFLIKEEHTPGFVTKWPEFVSELALKSFIIDDVQYVALYNTQESKPYKFKGYVNLEKYLKDKTEDYYDGNDKKPTITEDGIEVIVKRNGKKETFNMTKCYSKDADLDPYKGAGELLDMNSAKTVTDLVYVILPDQLLDYDSQEIISRVFTKDPALAIEGLIISMGSHLLPNWTFAVGHSIEANISLGYNPSELGLSYGGSVGFGLVINDGTIRGYGDLANLEGINKEIKNKQNFDSPLGKDKTSKGMSASYSIRHSLIYGGFDDYKAYFVSAGIGGSYSYIKGSVSGLFSWPHESPSFYEYVANMSKYDNIAVNDLEFKGISADVGITTDKVSFSIGLSESYTWVPTQEETKLIIKKGDEALENIFGVDFDLTIPEYTQMVYDDLNDYYLIQISANNDPADLTKLDEFYKGNVGKYYTFYDNVDKKYKYFLPKKFISHKQAKQFIYTLYYNDLVNIPQEQFIVKYNKNIAAITEKYSKYSAYTNTFYNDNGPRILFFEEYKEEYRTDPELKPKINLEKVPINTDTPKSVELTLKNASYLSDSEYKKIEISQVICDNNNIKFRYNKTIVNSEKFILEYTPTKKGAVTFDVTIVTNIGLLELEISAEGI